MTAAMDLAGVRPFGESGFRATDLAAVGLDPVDLDAGFAAAFAGQMRPRLARRADGFAALFAALDAIGGPRLLVETGTLRVPANWRGDGQSSVMFDLYAQMEGRAGRSVSFVSIDLSVASIAAARGVCSHATQLICNDSVHALHTLGRLLPPRAATLLYLDSYDLDVANPWPSAHHHLMELTAAAPLLGPGSLIMVDDFDVRDPADTGAGVPGGKGLLVDRYLASIGARTLYSGYARLWRMP